MCQITGADVQGDLQCKVTKPSTDTANFCQNATDSASCDRLWQFDALYKQVWTQFFMHIVQSEIVMFSCMSNMSSHKWRFPVKGNECKPAHEPFWLGL